MAFLSETQVDDIRSHIISDEALLQRKYKARKKEYDETSVSYNEVDSYLKDGWEETQRLKTKVKLQRKKKTGTGFEDKIWCMFYELGFRQLNSDENLTIKWGSNQGDHQQIDVLAIGDDAIFVVECKATATRKLGNFKSVIDHIEHTREGVIKSLQQLYGRDRKIKFILATDNYIVGKEDDTRLKEKNIFHFNNNAYNYVNSLIKAYKGCVIYQFYGLMFKNELVNDKKIRIPALRGKMGKHEYYMLSIEPATLLKLGFILHRTTTVNESLTPTYQRLLVPSRLNGIRNFIDNGGYFPNSIIVNFDTLANKKLRVQFEQAGKVGDDSESRFGTLILPNAYGIAYIIDGQHRVYGYANSKFKDTNTIPVVAFVNMDSSEQLQIFMDINENQKAVSPSLRLDLKEDLDWDSSRLDSRMGALRSSIIKALTRDANSVLFSKISVGEDTAKLTLKPFDEALKRSSLLPKCSQKKFEEDTDICIYDCYSRDDKKAMSDSRKEISQYIRDCYTFMKEVLDEPTYAYYIESNRGTFGLIALIGSLHKHLILNKSLTPQSNSAERFNAVKPYLEVLGNYLLTLSDEDKTTLEVRGQQADTTWLRKFQECIYKVFSDFKPDGLETWLETQDKDLQEEGHKIGKEIVAYLCTRVIEKAQELYGSSWENSLADVRARCKNRINEKELTDESFDAVNADWVDFIDFTDVKTIIEKCWSLRPEGNEGFITFEQEFSINIGGTFRTKKDKTRWLAELSSFKDSWEKAKPKLLTRNQVNLLHIMNQSLRPE